MSLDKEGAWERWSKSSRFARLVASRGRWRWMAKRTHQAAYDAGVDEALLHMALQQYWGICPGCHERMFLGFGAFCTGCHLDRALQVERSRPPTGGTP